MSRDEEICRQDLDKEEREQKRFNMRQLTFEKNPTELIMTEKLTKVGKKTIIMIIML